MSRSAVCGVIRQDDAAHNPCSRTMAGPVAGPTPDGALASQPETMKNRIRRVARQLSLPVSALAGALFAAGVIFGLIAYLDRSPVRQKNIPGASAWSQHLVVAAVALVLFGYAWWRRQRRFGRRSRGAWVLAPLAEPPAPPGAPTPAAPPPRPR